MELQDQLRLQRIKHIISSYELEGNEGDFFHQHLDALWHLYPSPWLELAFAETLVHNWSHPPMERGLQFLVQVDNQLQKWAEHGLISVITPEQFQHITGLDPRSVFEILSIL